MFFLHGALNQNGKMGTRLRKVYDLSVSQSQTSGRGLHTRQNAGCFCFASLILTIQQHKTHILQILQMKELAL